MRLVRARVSMPQTPGILCSFSHCPSDFTWFQCTASTEYSDTSSALMCTVFDSKKTGRP